MRRASFVLFIFPKMKLKAVNFFNVNCTYFISIRGFGRRYPVVHVETLKTYKDLDKPFFRNNLIEKINLQKDARFQGE